MCDKPESTTSSPLTLSAEDSPVRTSVVPGRGSVYQDRSLVFGEKCLECFASYDRDSQSLKTSQLCLTGEWSELYATFPKTGLMRNGKCYPLVDSVPHICVRGCSLWPTPRASGGGGNAGGSGGRLLAIRNGTYISGGTSPLCQEWLMGYPIGWTDCML